MTDTAVDPVRERVEMTLRLLIDGAGRLAEPPLTMLRTLVRLADGCLLGRGLYGGDRPAPADVEPPDVVDASDDDGGGSAADLARPVAAAPTAVAVTAADLPIDDYEHLAASQIVSRLERLDGDALSRVAAFERAHRHRRTVLGKIDRLLTAD